MLIIANRAIPLLSLNFISAFGIRIRLFLVSMNGGRTEWTINPPKLQRMVTCSMINDSRNIYLISDGIVLAGNAILGGGILVPLF